MNVVVVDHISKSFGKTKAVVDVSFALKQGEIFGLLGPNGAGKTTTIRVMLDIFRPDRGRVAILGGPMTEEKKNRIGYMPEERGLYQDVTLERCLVYLAMLKGMGIGDVRRELQKYLERFDLSQHRKKRVKDLSKGMQQKAQIISAILHKPELLIIDEPFAGLDPINTQLVKDLILELRANGTTIIMSTHQMQQVEEMCDRIVLIDKGHNVLYGKLDTIRRRFAGHAVRVRTIGELPPLDCVSGVTYHNGGATLTLDEGTNPQDVLGDLMVKQVPLEKFEIAMPTLNEIFIQVVKGGQR